MSDEVSKANLRERVIFELPDSVINQIKAGEVVERPLSVVKELVENALDADADEISIDLFDGGKAMIRVTDTGSGMSPEDAALAVRRHATSKLSALDDLDHIATFGFRGEALASIASVSRFVMRTRRALDPSATQIENDAGSDWKISAVASPQGTQIEVGELFCNTPARQKFLRNTATEYAHVHDFVLAMSLAFPKVAWSFSHNRRRVLHVRRADDLVARARDVLGESYVDYVPVSFEKGSFGVEGFAGLPSAARSVPQHFFVFVNGRLVRDKTIRAGVFQAYAGLIMKGLVPSAILFVQCDPRWVDVNVHPNKTEIRFRDPALVQDLVSLAVAGCLRPALQAKVMPLPETQQGLPLQALPQIKTSASLSLESAPSARPAVPTAQLTVRPVAPPISVNSGSAFLRQAREAERRLDTCEPGQIFEAPSFSPSPQAPLRYLGQFQKLYLLLECTESRELWVVDQHAFHERILYEGYLRSAEAPIPRQSLLTPLFVPLPASIGPVVASQSEVLGSLGFEVEWCEPMERLAIHAYPAFVDITRLTQVFDEVLVRLLVAVDPQLVDMEHPLLARVRDVRSAWASEGRAVAGLSPKDVFHLVYATIACHAAVRAGQDLRPEQVQYLLARARSVDFSAHCPHGRPVMRRFPITEVATWFERI